MPIEWQEKQKDDFKTKLIVDAKNGSSIVLKSFNKDGFNSPMVQALFYSSLKDILLIELEEINFDEFVKNRLK